MMKHRNYFPLVLLALGTGLTLAASAGPAQSAENPRLLVLPWVVIDRTTHMECVKHVTGQAPGGVEAQRLAMSAQAALDAAMHRHRMFEMIPRKEWEPHWKASEPGQVVRQGTGCAVCTPAGALLRYDREGLRRLGEAVGAEYIWIGVTITPLTREGNDSRADACCREAPAQEREAVLARSSALLIRARDGETVWQRDARRLSRDVPARLHKVVRSPERRREVAVDGTAHALGEAFGREHREALR